jgi:hypothetical protein
MNEGDYMASAPARTFLTFVMFLIVALPAMARAGQYKNFRVAVYIPASVVERMKDPAWLRGTWETISQQLKVDKVYIETYRSRRIVDEGLIEQVKKFFLDHGVQVAGGIAAHLGRRAAVRNVLLRRSQGARVCKEDIGTNGAPL